MDDLKRPNAEFAAAMEEGHHVEETFVVTLKPVRGGHVPGSRRVRGEVVERQG
jgi:hypothetical protein